MAYIGKSPIIGNFVKLDAITAVNGQAAYTMQNGGSNFTDYESVNQFLVSLNGTIQAPTDSFTVSGSTLTFASNLATGDVIDFIMVFGNSLSAGVPTDATVSTAKIVDDAVTAAKINNDIISGSTELATTPADTDEFLISDAGTIKRIDYSHIKGSSDWVKLANSTVSSVSSLSFEDTFTDDYQYYKIFIKDFYFSSADIPVFNYLTSGSTQVTTGYFTVSNYAYGTTGSSTGGQAWRHWNGDDHGLAITNTGTSADSPMWCELTLLNPRSTTKRRLSICLSGMYGNDSNLYSETIRSFNSNTGTAFGGIKIQGNGSQTIGSITATVYGIK